MPRPRHRTVIRKHLSGLGSGFFPTHTRHFMLNSPFMMGPIEQLSASAKKGISTTPSPLLASCWLWPLSNPLLGHLRSLNWQKMSSHGKGRVSESAWLKRFQPVAVWEQQSWGWAAELPGSTRELGQLRPCSTCISAAALALQIFPTLHREKGSFRGWISSHKVAPFLTLCTDCRVNHHPQAPNSKLQSQLPVCCDE